MLILAFAGFIYWFVYGGFYITTVIFNVFNKYTKNTSTDFLAFDCFFSYHKDKILYNRYFKKQMFDACAPWRFIFKRSLLTHALYCSKYINIVEDIVFSSSLLAVTKKIHKQSLCLCIYN